MFSYNNIIAKREPKLKGLIEAIGSDLLKGNGGDSEARKLVLKEVDGADVVVIDDFLSDEECEAIIRESRKVGFTLWAEQPAEVAEDEDYASNPLCSSECDVESAKLFRTAETIEGRFPNIAELLWKRLEPVFGWERGCLTFHKDMQDADKLYERDLEGSWVPAGFSENLLVARYGPGGHFAPHVDGSTVVDLNTRSLYTALLYLNDVPPTDGSVDLAGWEFGAGGTRVFSGEQCDVMVKDAVTGRVSGDGASPTLVDTIIPRRGRLAVFYHNVLHEGVAVGSGGEKFIIRGDILYKRTPPVGTEKDVEAFNLFTAAREAESNGDAMKAVDLFQRAKKMSRLIADLYQL